MTLKEACEADGMDPAKVSSTLQSRIDKLPAKLEEDAVWARKRPLIRYRLERAEGAIATLADKFKSYKPNELNKILEEMGFSFSSMTIGSNEHPLA